MKVETDRFCPPGHVYWFGDTLIVPTVDPLTWQVGGEIVVHGRRQERQMTYEWEEEVPQPKPPTRRCSLLVFSGEDRLNAANYRPATLADIARALGVEEAELSGFLRRRIEGCAQIGSTIHIERLSGPLAEREHRARIQDQTSRMTDQMLLGGQAGARCVCKPAGSGNCAACQQGMLR